MSKLLKKEGKFVKRNGKLVKTDDPAKCPCCVPPPPPVKYICAIRSPCSELPLRAGRWGWIADGRWIPVDNGCARYPPFLCTMAPAPNRPGVVGETVNVGCVEVTPSTTKECITEEEFDKGGWIKVSGPHDTIQICEAACNPPPPPPDCPPGKIARWMLPDCGPGPCQAICFDENINPCEGFPYDCDSEGSCNGWLDAHPNAPCPQAENPLP